MWTTPLYAVSHLGAVAERRGGTVGKLGTQAGQFVHTRRLLANSKPQRASRQRSGPTGPTASGIPRRVRQ